mmetsp:Transcript_2632/g.6112  ORF Transcript_2632/g.6112 Transcript_2632/m.6112 type:complete len:298 (-) Transcript_2632:710-1603(-)
MSSFRLFVHMFFFRSASSLLSSACFCFHSCGVRWSRNFRNFTHSSFCSLYFEISLCIWAILPRRCFIFWSRSCFTFVISSACFIALCAFASFACRNVSNRVTSSSSICCDFLSAVSFALAFSSSFRISAFFTSRDICTRNISLFLATKSVVFSLSRGTAFLSTSCPASSFLTMCAGLFVASSRRRFEGISRQDAVFFSQTFWFFFSSRSSALRRFSSSRSRKISSSGGRRNGFSTVTWPEELALAILPRRCVSGATGGVWGGRRGGVLDVKATVVPVSVQNPEAPRSCRLEVGACLA